MHPRDEIARVKVEIEKRHLVELPNPQLVYSDNVSRAFFCSSGYFPQPVPSATRTREGERVRRELESMGLKSDELVNLDPMKPIIVIPRGYCIHPVKLCATLYEELGHEAAYVAGIVEKTANEGIALAWRFKGLLKGAEQGTFSLADAVDQIESDIKGLQHDLSFFRKLEDMKLKIPKNLPHRHYNAALFAIREYNPQLQFRGRPPDEVIVELDRSIDYILKFSERVRRKCAKLRTRVKSLVRSHAATHDPEDTRLRGGPQSQPLEQQ